MDGAAYGFADMGPYNGGQAELLRVPFGDFNCLVLPEDARERQSDYVMPAGIWPTGRHATQLACVQAGDSVVIYGAGPVGLIAAYSATFKSAGMEMVVDRHPDRLAKAEEIGSVGGRPGRRGSSHTSWAWTTRPAATSTSTGGIPAGPRSSCVPPASADPPVAAAGLAVRPLRPRTGHSRHTGR
ncbi:hypothetical protein AB0O28_04650 [Microbispora sp. NPDC088329]|uniref:hypothetical protein n=1 Tax=Microbispora sp. NPDC088329 TaxID=3154869 RepID=UPI00341D734E